MVRSSCYTLCVCVYLVSINYNRIWQRNAAHFVSGRELSIWRSDQDSPHKWEIYFNLSASLATPEFSACTYLDSRNKLWRRTLHGISNSVGIHRQCDQHNSVWPSALQTELTPTLSRWLWEPSRAANCTEWRMSSSQQEPNLASL